MKTLLIPLATTLCLTAGTVAADNTLRGKHLRVDSQALPGHPADHSAPATDTVPFPPADSVKLSGYDKPLNSMKESLLITNRSNHSISGLRIEITYLDLAGRELHGTMTDLHVDIPPGAIRKAVFPSWDTQRSYYYHLGKKPRTANVTPYTVSCRVIHYTTQSQ